ncbi:hypothetical protein S83_055597, partial [Arachis hypogaea]
VDSVDNLIMLRGYLPVNGRQVSLGRRINSKIRHDALEHVVGEGDRNYIWELRMNSNYKEDFERMVKSRETISKYFNKVLKAVICIQSILFAKTLPVEDDCIDPTWRMFK